MTTQQPSRLSQLRPDQGDVWIGIGLVFALATLLGFVTQSPLGGALVVAAAAVLIALVAVPVAIARRSIRAGFLSTLTWTVGFLGRWF